MGPLQFGKREEMIFLGREIAQHQDYSEHTAMEIDREVRRIVMENYERAKGLVQRRSGDPAAPRRGPPGARGAGRRRH